MQQSYIRKWVSFTNKRKFSAIQVPVDQVIQFMTELYDLWLRYSALNTSRSSLSALAISSESCFVIGKHTLVIRFLKCAFHLRPIELIYSKKREITLNVSTKKIILYTIVVKRFVFETMYVSCIYYCC